MCDPIVNPRTFDSSLWIRDNAVWTLVFAGILAFRRKRAGSIEDEEEPKAFTSIFISKERINARRSRDLMSGLRAATLRHTHANGYTGWS